MATVQPSTFLQETNSELPTLRKIKREATPHTKPTQVASHFILPNRTTAAATVSTLVKIFSDY
jgi:hypothetical protein